MAKSTIDIFSLFKQWKAVISPESLRDHLVFLGEHLYGSQQFFTEDPYDFEREIKEGI